MSERTFFSEWILPISRPPIKHGFITLNQDTIKDLGEQRQFKGNSKTVQHLDNTVILPALVNALYHPDYPIADPQSTPRGNFFNWLHSKKSFTRMSSKIDVESDLLSTIKRCYDYGTGAIGMRTMHPEISKHLEQSGLYSAVFQIYRGFRSFDALRSWKQRRVFQDTDLIHFYEAGEFLFNLAPDIFREIAKDNARTALPLAFTRDEELFMQKGTGRIYQYLLGQEDMDYRWQPPHSSSVRYFISNAFSAQDNILSQVILITEEDLDLLNERPENYHMCLHPRFDRQWEQGTAPGQLILKKGFNICLGTFAEHMDMRREMRSASAEYGFKPNEIIRMATLNGAKALGFDDRIGSLEPGKDARIFSVKSESSIADPYEAVLFNTERMRQIS